MIGIDLGLNVGSLTYIDKKGRVIDTLVIKNAREEDDDLQRIRTLGIRYAQEVKRMVRRKGNYGISPNISIEEPIYSWGRKNPKVFAKSAMLFYWVWERLFRAGYTVKRINNKAAKLAAGHGNLDKEGMIKAFKKCNGCLPGSKTKYGQETLADSYFIAKAGSTKDD